MSEYILNLLPLKEGEEALFEQAAAGATHVWAERKSVTDEQYRQATAILGWPVEEDLKRCPDLKWVHCMWAGADMYLKPGVLPDGVMLTKSSGSNSQSVAEHMLASLLALCRKLPQCRDAQRQHVWCKIPKARTLSGATVLVVGAGHIGSVFAALCRGLGAHTVGLKRTVTGPVDGFDEVYPVERLDEWLPRADVAALCLPHDESTVGLMDRKRLEAMKDDAMLVNAGRGSVLDQEGLVELLRAGKFWGVALDVTDPEPLPEDHPLWDAPNLLLTPHVAGGLRLDITRDLCIQMALENLEHYMKGEPLDQRIR